MLEISPDVWPSAAQRGIAISRFDNFTSVSGINFGVKHRDMPKCAIWVNQAILNCLASSSVSEIGSFERASDYRL
jgi:hypothetical protein